MSSILKALQKLEQERVARRGGAPDISGEILKRGKAERSTPRWLLPTAMAIVAAAAVLATYTLMGGFSVKKGGIASTTTSLTPVPPPAVPAQATGTRGVPATAPALPPAEVVRDIPVVRRTVTREASLAPKPVPRPKPAPASLQQNAATPVKEDTPPPTPAEPPRPSLNVGGIAWQQNNALRLAVVNGMSVSEGSVVEGARVEEIFPDRVRFSFRNQHFELPLGK